MSMVERVLLYKCDKNWQWDQPKSTDLFGRFTSNRGRAEEAAKNTAQMEVCTHYKLNISPAKIKTMAFSGRDPVRTKIIAGYQLVEHVGQFTNLGCTVD